MGPMFHAMLFQVGGGCEAYSCNRAVLRPPSQFGIERWHEALQTPAATRQQCHSTSPRRMLLSTAYLAGIEGGCSRSLPRHAILTLFTTGSLAILGPFSFGWAVEGQDVYRLL